MVKVNGTIDRDRNTVVVIQRLRERYLEFTADRDRCRRKFMRERVVFLTITITLETS